MTILSWLIDRVVPNNFLAQDEILEMDPLKYFGDQVLIYVNNEDFQNPARYGGV